MFNHKDPHLQSTRLPKSDNQSHTKQEPEEMWGNLSSLAMTTNIDEKRWLDVDKIFNFFLWQNRSFNFGQNEKKFSYDVSKFI